jgi:polysaccharide deacetylase
MITLKKMEFYNTLFILIIISSILSLAYTSILFLPIMARTHTSHSLHQEQQQQKQVPIPQALSKSISNNQQTISNVPIDPNKVVIITFGDGYQSQYSYAKPVLDKYGYKGNFFVTCNRVGTSTKMTWPELVQLYKEGNVIGSKTVDYGTKAMANRDLNHLSPQELEFEVSQSKQCLANHGINTTFFAVPKNLANDNATVINTIAKYYTLAINGHSNLMYLHCNGGEQDSIQTNCRTYFDNGTLTPENRYSVDEWSMQHLGHGNSFNDSQMFDRFVAEVNSQNKFNKNGMINAIPLVGYHDIVTYPDAKYSNVSSDTTLNLFNSEIKYLHDNGFRVLTFYNLGYDDKDNVFFIK